MLLITSIHLSRFLWKATYPLKELSTLKRMNSKSFVPISVSFRKIAQDAKSFKKPVFDINTNVAKDVLLFRFDNNNFFHILNAFGLCQFGFWLYLSHFAYTSLRDIPVNAADNLPWWRRINLGEKKYRISITAISFLIGCGILSATCFYTMKSIRFLVLHKGGRDLTIITYGPFGMNQRRTVGLEQVSCQASRHSSRVQIPLKVQGSYLYYMLDMRGQFTNPALFDHTAGLKRNL